MVRFVDQPGGEATSFGDSDRMLVEPAGGSTKWFDYDRLVLALDARRAVGCHLTEVGGAQSIPDATWTALTFDTETFDHGSCHSTVSNTERITIPSGEKGVYIVGGIVSFATGTTGNRQARITKGASTVLTNNGYGALALDSTLQNRILVVTVAVLDAAEYITLDGYQTSTAALDTAYLSTQFFAYQITKLP